MINKFKMPCFFFKCIVELNYNIRRIYILYNKETQEHFYSVSIPNEVYSIFIEVLGVINNIINDGKKKNKKIKNKETVRF